MIRGSNSLGTILLYCEFQLKCPWLPSSIMSLVVGSENQNRVRDDLTRVPPDSDAWSLSLHRRL